MYASTTRQVRLLELWHDAEWSLIDLANQFVFTVFRFSLISVREQLSLSQTSAVNAVFYFCYLYYLWFKNKLVLLNSQRLICNILSFLFSFLVLSVFLSFFFSFFLSFFLYLNLKICFKYCDKDVCTYHVCCARYMNSYNIAYKPIKPQELQYTNVRFE